MKIKSKLEKGLNIKKKENDSTSESKISNFRSTFQPQNLQKMA